MTQDEIIEMARQAELGFLLESGFMCHQEVKAFAKLVAEKEREVVANWIMDRGFATGHGDSIVDLLDQLEWQIAEKEREKSEHLLWLFQEWKEDHLSQYNYIEAVEAIRARGENK